MVEKTPWLDLITYALLIIGIGIVGFPIFYTIVAATLPLEEVSRIPMPLIPGDQILVNLMAAWNKGNLGTQMWSSFIMAAGITVGKISVSMLAAYAIVYFDFRFRKIAFVSVFCTLMLPVEVRILPTYEVTASVFGPIQRILTAFHVDTLIGFFTGNRFQISIELSLLDSYAGLILPLVASATATFLFRLVLPDRSGRAL